MFTLVPILISAVLSGPSAPVSQPSLSHSAPFLGHVLEIEVDGAAASQPVVLFYSPHAGNSSTPFGLFELERQTSQRIRVGTTDAQGHASFAITIPPNASLAELQAHFQALIDDPAAVEGKVFSQAAHLRLLGTRIYTGLGTGISVVSAIREAVAVRVALDSTAWSSGSAVFRHDFAVGAVLGDSNELIRFDPFFGTVLGRQPFGPSSTTLLTDLDEERVFVLETAGRITAVDLASGAVVGQVDLPNPAGLWCSNARRTEAYVAESVGPEGRPALRRIDLGSLTDLGSFAVANDDPDQDVTSVVFANQTVFVTTEWHQWLPAAARGALTRIDLSSLQPVVTVQFEEGFRMLRSTPVPHVDELVVVAQTIVDGAPGVPMHHLTSLSQTAPFVDAGYPHDSGGASTFMAALYDTEARDSALWAIGRGDFEDSFGFLYRLDLDDLTWWRYPKVWHIFPHDLEIARDDYVDCLYVAVPSFFDPQVQASELLVIDHAANVERHIPLPYDPRVIRVVEVP